VTVGADEGRGEAVSREVELATAPISATPSTRSPIRALVLSAAYPAPSDPERAIFVENLTRSLATTLASASPNDGSRTVQVAVVAPRVGDADPQLEDRWSILVERFTYPSRGRRLKEIERPSLFLMGFYVLSGLRLAFRVARRQRSDVVVVHWALPMGPIGALVALTLRLPLVVVAHGSDIHRYARTRGLLHIACRWSLRRARRVIAVSRALECELTEHLGVPTEKLFYLPMGVDGELFTPQVNGAGQLEARRELGIEAECRALLFVGDLHECKGLSELSHAWRALRADRPDVQLWLIGDGPFSATLRSELAPWIEDGAVRLCGRVSQANLASWYRAADLFVLPSHSEGTPVSILEALSCGLPVVATRVGGIGDVVIDGKTGVLVPPRSTKALVEALSQLLDHDGSLARMRSSLLERPVDHSASKQAGQLRVVLQEVCGAS